ncbi:uncharacterized protein [Scyliorhinus torazame]|uniref:uncharacterized protein isoform X3 n=1 Tax=Scyliorhinus torazame TaxID=75743 RepID=UPI003B5CBCF7
MFFQEIFAIYGNVYFFVGYVQYVDSYSSGLGRLEKRKALRLYSPLLDYIRIAKSQQDHFQVTYNMWTRIVLDSEDLRKERPFGCQVLLSLDNDGAATLVFWTFPCWIQAPGLSVFLSGTLEEQNLKVEKSNQISDQNVTVTPFIRT